MLRATLAEQHTQNELFALPLQQWFRKGAAMLRHTSTSSPLQYCKEKKDFFLCWYVDCVWNVMAHAQKPHFVFRRNGRVHLNRQGASVQSTTGSRGVCISGSNAGYTMFRGSVKSSDYPLHSPVSLSLPLPCVKVFHHISTGLYNIPRCTYFGISLEDVVFWHDLTGHWGQEFKHHKLCDKSPRHNI